MKQYSKVCVFSLMFVISACILSSAALAAEHPTLDAKDGWQSLFNGKDLTGWQLKRSNGTPAKPNAWVVEDRALACKGGGNCYTTEEFGDFVLDLEFKISPAGNSGVMLRYKHDPTAKSYWWNGLLEVQVFDSAGKAKPGMHDCGALYDMIAPSKNAMKKAGEWNRFTITAKGNEIKVVLNGEQIIDVDLDDWPEVHKNPNGTKNKYNKPMKDQPKKGVIFFQDYGNPVSYRNIYIKKLD